MSRFVALAVLAVGLLADASATPAPRPAGDTPTIRSIALGVGPGGGCELLAMLREEEGLQGETLHALVLRTIHQATGMREGADLTLRFPPGVIPMALLVSSFFRPGSVLVLDIDANIHVFPVGFDNEESPVLVDNPDLLPIGGLIGDPDSIGPALSLGEAPGRQDPQNPTAAPTPVLAIGTALGRMVLHSKTPGPPEVRLAPLSTGPILSITAIPDPAGAAFLALASVGPGGGCIFGINPDTGGILFDAEVPGTEMLASISYPVSDLIRNLGTRPSPLLFVTGADVVRLAELIEVDVNDQAIVTFRNDGTVQVSPGRTQVVTGSLAIRVGDGSGVLYDPAFRLENGFGSPLLTIAGATMEVFPGTLNRRSRGKFIAAVIEVENMGALDILPETVTLTIGDVRIPARSSDLGDEDLDGNPDLLVRFSRDQARTAFEQGQVHGPAVVGTLWKNQDGSTGRATASIRVIP